MDWSSFWPNIIATLVGVLVAFLLGFIGFIIQVKITNNSTKKEWSFLLSQELKELKRSLNALKENNMHSFINTPIIDSFLKNSAIQQLFSFSYLAELCNIYCKIQNYNKYVEVNLLVPQTFDNDFFEEKINAILEKCDKAQEIKDERRKLHNRSNKNIKFPNETTQKTVSESSQTSHI